MSRQATEEQDRKFNEQIDFLLSKREVALLREQEAKRQARNAEQHQVESKSWSKSLFGPLVDDVGECDRECPLSPNTPLSPKESLPPSKAQIMLDPIPLPMDAIAVAQGRSPRVTVRADSNVGAAVQAHSRISRSTTGDLRPALRLRARNLPSIRSKSSALDITSVAQLYASHMPPTRSLTLDNLLKARSNPAEDESRTYNASSDSGRLRGVRVRRTSTLELLASFEDGSGVDEQPARWTADDLNLGAVCPSPPSGPPAWVGRKPHRHASDVSPGSVLALMGRRGGSVPGVMTTGGRATETEVLQLTDMIPKPPRHTPMKSVTASPRASGHTGKQADLKGM